MDCLKALFKKFCNKEIIFYLIFGVLTTLVSLIVYYFCTLAFLNPQNAVQLQIANIISWVLSVAFAYVTNRIIVFKSKSKEILKEFISFISARILTLGMEMLIMFIFVTALGLNSDLWVVIWSIVAQIVVIVANYIFSKLFIFKKGEKNEKN